MTDKTARRLRTLEESRVKIDITKCMTRLAKVLEILDEKRGEWKPTSSVELGAMKLDVDIQFRLLGKVMADLKQVDMNLFQPDEPRTVPEVLNDITTLFGSNPELAPFVARIEHLSAADADTDLPN